MKKVVIFARVSSTNGTQDYERQINDLQTLASANNWTVEAVFAEKVSGAKKNTERTELMNMINYINSHNINKVLVTELSKRKPIRFQNKTETCSSKRGCPSC